MSNCKRRFVLVYPADMSRIYRGVSPSASLCVHVLTPFLALVSATAFSFERSQGPPLVYGTSSQRTFVLNI